mmetsp:Transcript_29548/g.73746  ORF Transcript_29548/g.73746 Transcript_29548/m.73746 type:complete len:222 (-) Transcript_29548:590-1255(-)
MSAYGAARSHGGYAPLPSTPAPGSKPSLSALLWSLTPISPCKRNATQSAWCSRRAPTPLPLVGWVVLSWRSPSNATPVIGCVVPSWRSLANEESPLLLLLLPLLTHQEWSLHNALVALRTVWPSGAMASTAGKASARFSLYSMGAHSGSPVTASTMSTVPEVPSTDTAVICAATVRGNLSNKAQSAPLHASTQPPSGTPSPPLPPPTMGGYAAASSCTMPP